MAPSRRSIKTTFSSNNNFGAAVGKESKSKSKALALPNANLEAVSTVPVSNKVTSTVDMNKGVTTATVKACAPFVRNGNPTNIREAEASPTPATTTGAGAVSKAILAHTQAQAKAEEPKDAIVKKQAKDWEEEEEEKSTQQSIPNDDPLSDALPAIAVHLPLPVLPSEFLLDQRDVRAYEHARQKVKRAGEREVIVARRAAKKEKGNLGGVCTPPATPVTLPVSTSTPASGTATPTTVSPPVSPVSVSVSVFSKLAFGFGRKGKKEVPSTAGAPAPHTQAKSNKGPQTHCRSRTQSHTHGQGESKILKKLGKGRSFNLTRDAVELDYDDQDDSDSSSDPAPTTATRTREVLLSDLVVVKRKGGVKGRGMEDGFEMVPAVRAVIVLDDADEREYAGMGLEDEEDDEGDNDNDDDEWECISKDGGDSDKDAPLSYAQVVLGAV